MATALQGSEVFPCHRFFSRAGLLGGEHGSAEEHPAVGARASAKVKVLVHLELLANLALRDMA